MVSRDALEEESDGNDDEHSDEEGSGNEDAEFDDPETADLEEDEAAAEDSEIDSEDALTRSDAERFEKYTFRGSSKPNKASLRSKRSKAADYMSDSEGGADLKEVEKEGTGSEDNEASSSEDSDDDAEEHDADEDEDEMSVDSENDAAAPVASKKEKQRKGAREIKQQSSTATESPDVTKGTAIQQQRKAYDGLLNLRIRFQKALIAANTFPILELDSPSDPQPYEAAEQAAISLLQTLGSLRETFTRASSKSLKRKRQLEVSMPTEDIWDVLCEQDKQATHFRETRLEKWSRKVQSVNVAAQRGLASRNKTMIAALQQQLAEPDSRLVKRTRVPRSCAPGQAARKMNVDDSIYDDADFYQLLLKDLVDQRTSEQNSTQTSAVPTVMLTVAKEAKVRKNVDRKASKGRKMRFTVHEKLQNFMAPEDRRSWEQGAIDRFFGTMFGQKMELDEVSDDEDELVAEAEGLRLFRS